MKKIIWLLVFFTAFGIKAQGQCSFCLDCVDSARINVFQDCSGGGTFNYAPYCGCDGNWYNNECSAYWHGGVSCPANSEACCPPLHFILLPNLVAEGQVLFQIYLRQGLSGFVNIRLIDSFGKLKQTNNIFFNEGSQPVPVNLDVQGLRPGVYYIFVQAQGVTLWEKFVKI